MFDTLEADGVDRLGTVFPRTKNLLSVQTSGRIVSWNWLEWDSLKMPQRLKVV